MSTRYPGGLITKTPVVPTINSAPGVWTLEQALIYIKAGTWPGGVTIDPFFNQTTLLLHGDGTNGAQNNTFLDGSTNNFTITRNGNTTQGTFSPFSLAAGQWSNYFEGTNGFLTTASNAAFTFGTGDFTVEFWCYPISSTGPGGYAYLYAQGPNTTASLGIYFQSNTFRVWNGSAVITGTVSRTTNTWYHVAVSRSGTSMKLFVNGVQDGSTATNSSNITTGSTFGANIGRWAEISDANYLVGYLSNVRVVKGTAVYTSTFTPPTTPLTAITNTSLLTCQSNRFVDNSTNAFAITRNGDVRVTPFSPFAPSAAYSAGTNGGSGYFDGTGDYLTVPNNTALDVSSGDFTVEAWFYTTSVATDRPIVIRFNGNAATRVDLQYILLLRSNNTLRITPYSSTTIYDMEFTNVPLNQWNHCALVRTGNNFYAYLNGVRSATTQTITGSLNNGTWETWIGGYREGNTFFHQLGFISSVRVTKGTALYTGSTYTVPTAPLTAITNTSLLLNFTNAGILDNTGKNNLETVGNAQIDTAVKKYGTGSLEFDGTADYVVQPANENYGYGTGDFTIEFWLYLNSVATQTIVSNLTSASSTNPHLYLLAADDKIYYFTVGANRIAGPVLTTGVWYHIALCRASGSTRLFVDGTQQGSTYADTNNYGATAPLGIGTYWASGSPVTTDTLNGFIDDLRITKGVARYTANFTPPTAAFPNQ